jgi:hypothetical protein
MIKKAVFKNFNTAQPFEYSFINDDHEKGLMIKGASITWQASYYLAILIPI